MSNNLEQNLNEIEEMFKNGMMDRETYENIKKEIMENDTVQPPSQEAAPAAEFLAQNTNMQPVGNAPTAPPAPVAPKYYVLIAGKKIGPFEREDFINKIRAEEYGKKTMVWMTGMDENWVEAGTLPELENYFPDLPPSSPAAQAGGSSNNSSANKKVNVLFSIKHDVSNKKPFPIKINFKSDTPEEIPELVLVKGDPRPLSKDEGQIVDRVPAFKLKKGMFSGGYTASITIMSAPVSLSAEFALFPSAVNKSIKFKEVTSLL